MQGEIDIFLSKKKNNNISTNYYKHSFNGDGLAPLKGFYFWISDPIEEFNKKLR